MDTLECMEEADIQVEEDTVVDSQWVEAMEAAHGEATRVPNLEDSAALTMDSTGDNFRQFSHYDLVFLAFYKQKMNDFQIELLNFLEKKNAIISI